MLNIVLWLLLGLVMLPSAPVVKAREYTFHIVHTYPHDASAFTQGLEFRGGYLYEGTGLAGQSTLRKEKLETGEILQETRVAPTFFGEGITVINQHILELTWKAQIGFIYDQPTFRKINTFSYPGEGWGLANDGRTIYMSDGSSQIRCLDPNTLTETRRIDVHDGSAPATELNELECVRGEIYANVWHSWRIARIRPSDGLVVGWIDLSGIISPQELTSPEAVLNGIAYDSMGDRMFVTGKLWPKLFEIKVLPKR
ncbi:MAG TPA: glutaminyl-peptide cyclotransferase [Bryobacteraceae bacterium]|jgi:glutaminyl-peptide cyclotransferase|nr:glutaminyl-peptide cyclotransferase [Bryobacteraceae bacterium]